MRRVLNYKGSFSEIIVPLILIQVYVRSPKLNQELAKLYFTPTNETMVEPLFHRPRPLWILKEQPKMTAAGCGVSYLAPSKGQQSK